MQGETFSSQGFSEKKAAKSAPRNFSEPSFFGRIPLQHVVLFRNIMTAFSPAMLLCCCSTQDENEVFSRNSKVDESKDPFFQVKVAKAASLAADAAVRAGNASGGSREMLTAQCDRDRNISKSYTRQQHSAPIAKPKSCSDSSIPCPLFSSTQGLQMRSVDNYQRQQSAPATCPRSTKPRTASIGNSRTILRAVGIKEPLSCRTECRTSKIPANKGNQSTSTAAAQHQGHVHPFQQPATARRQGSAASSEANDQPASEPVSHTVGPKSQSSSGNMALLKEAASRQGPAASSEANDSHGKREFPRLPTSDARLGSHLLNKSEAFLNISVGEAPKQEPPMKIGTDSAAPSPKATSSTVACRMGLPCAEEAPMMAEQEQTVLRNAPSPMPPASLGGVSIDPHYQKATCTLKSPESDASQGLPPLLDD